MVDLQCGTFFYHSGTYTSKQLPMGLTGAFVSHCDYDHPVDVDIYWLHSGFEMSVGARDKGGLQWGGAEWNRDKL